MSKDFLIKEVTPAAAALPDEEADACKVHQRQEAHLADAAHYRAAHNRTKQRAVKGHAAAAQIMVAFVKEFIKSGRQTEKRDNR